MTTKEMYDEIATLLGSIAKALELPEDQVAKAVEDGSVALEMGADDHGRYVRASREGRAARIYDGAILYEDQAPPSQSGGCSCGH